MTATAACRASRAGRGGTGGGAGGGAGGSSTGGGAGGVEEVSAGNSKAKAEFIIGLVEHFEQGKISGAAMAKASDREAAKMLMGTWGGIKGLGEWSAGSVLMHFLGRADVMLYGDLTIRNYITTSTTCRTTRLPRRCSSRRPTLATMDPTGIASTPSPRPTVGLPTAASAVVCFLMYHLQEDNLVLL